MRASRLRDAPFPVHVSVSMAQHKGLQASEWCSVTAPLPTRKHGGIFGNSVGRFDPSMLLLPWTKGSTRARGASQPYHRLRVIRYQSRTRETLNRFVVRDSLFTRACL